jgi:hypothetical protein
MFDSHEVCVRLGGNLAILRAALQDGRRTREISPVLAPILEKAIADHFNQMLAIFDVAAEELLRVNELQLQICEFGRLARPRWHKPIAAPLLQSLDLSPFWMWPAIR